MTPIRCSRLRSGRTGSTSPLASASPKTVTTLAASGLQGVAQRRIETPLVCLPRLATAVIFAGVALLSIPLVLPSTMPLLTCLPTFPTVCMPYIFNSPFVRDFILCLIKSICPSPVLFSFPDISPFYAPSPSEPHSCPRDYIPLDTPTFLSHAHTPAG